MPKNKEHIAKKAPTNEDKHKKAEDFPEIEAFKEEFGDILAAWEFPEYIKPDRGKWWYISFSVIAVAFLIYSYFSRNPLFAIIIVLFIIIYYLTEKKDPINMEVIFTEDGFIINDKFMEYKDFENFYIIYYPPQIKNLYLQPKNHLKSVVVLPMEKEDPVHIRETLLRFLDEDLAKEEMPASEGISRILKL
ncbi:MAG: hypothetical protein HOA57_03780 [Candidatus Magasanikbacteria bacterium]|jgi:hypothetical protein|nr:hypothetical protein [Candidatus Magasanikbacteria bacterium]